MDALCRRPAKTTAGPSAGRTFHSRLIVGTGKYKDYALNAAAAEAAGAEIVTVAVRRVNLTDPSQPMLIDFIEPDRFTYLPNTAGCFTGEDAVRTLRLAREAGGWDLVKLEVLSDAKTLYPDMVETLRGAEAAGRRGLPGDGLLQRRSSMRASWRRPARRRSCRSARRSARAWACRTAVNIRLIVEQAKVPVIVDAGVGTASDAAVAMELGCDGVLMNTAIAEAKDPIRMARAMKHAVIAGREAFLAGRMPKNLYADPSSPLGGLI